MTPRRIALVVAAAVVLAAGVSMVDVSAQRGGGGRGGGGMGGGMTPSTRMPLFVTMFKLDKTQEKAVKAAMDAAYRSAAPTRDALTKAHAAIGAAIVSGDDRGSLNDRIAQYAAVAAQMADLEMTALAAVLTIVPEAQRPPQAIDAAAAMMRGAFAGKKWDEAPGTKAY